MNSVITRVIGKTQHNFHTILEVMIRGGVRVVKKHADSDSNFLLKKQFEVKLNQLYFLLNL